MTTNVDLRELAVERGPRGEGAALPRRRRAWISRRVLPGGIAIGFLSLIGWAARDQLQRSISVSVTPVLAKRGEARAAAGVPLFQAAGWVEPRPRPVFATALTMGVVKEVLVVEGQDIRAGEPLARLIDADASLAVAQAKASEELRRAELASTAAEREAAETRLARPVHLDAALAEAESLLAEIDAELQALPFQLSGAEARLGFARNNLEGKRSADVAISARLRQQAESSLEEADAAWSELQGRAKRLGKQREALDRRREALASQRELLVEEKRAVADAIAKESAAKAQLDHAKLDLQVAELAFSRTTIVAPIDGRVLEVLAQPGTRVSGLAGETLMSAAAVASLYDPKMLQVRADVRLDDVRSLSPGQSVKIETSAAPAPFKGVVLSATSQANVGKNTLEVKVSIDDPPPTIRPEMLVTTTFLAPEREREETQSDEAQLRVLVPRSAVSEASGGASVWIAAAGDIARQKSVKLGSEYASGMVEVVTGLAPGDWVIAGDTKSLTEGCRIVVEDEIAEPAAPAASPFPPASEGSSENHH